MNKITVVYLMTILALVLSACSGTSGTQIATTQSNPIATLPMETRLLLGTIKLEGTDLAVTAEQAAGLLPLWQVFRGLITSDTAAQAEINALIEQIQETMTADQMKAINAMNLTQQDVFAIMQEQGVGISQRSTTTSSDSSSSGAQGGGIAPPDGGGEMPIGSPPDDGGGMPMGDAGGTDTTESDTTGSPAMNPSSLLIDALIELLQSKIAS